MNTASIRLNKKAIVLAVISALYPVVSYGAAAKVEFAIGRVSVVGSDGRERPLVKGVEINQGDTVQTTQDGRAQLRFSDGGYISLQPNTQFRVDEYNYDGKTDGGEKGFFSLLKGGLRAITGAVGHVNKETYRVNTPVATIGIRGTEFLAQYDGVLRVKVGNGAVYMSNPTGDLVLFSGQSGEVSNENSQPEYSNEEPSVTAAGPQGNTPGEVEDQSQQEQQQTETFKVAEQYTESGTSCVVVGNCPVVDSAGPTEPTAFKTLTNQGIVIAHYDDEPGDELFGELKGVLPGTIEFDSSGRIIRISGQDASGVFSVSNFTGTFLDSGTDQALTWTRLNGGTVLVSDEEGTNTANITNAHFIYGAPTSASDISALHAQSASATYDLIGGTRPTDALGNVGMLHSGSYLSVNFGSPNVYAYLSGNMPAGPASGSFSGSGYGSIYANGQFEVSGCCGTCMAGIGFFAGPNAAQAGMSYAIDTGAAAGAITGTAAFKKGLPPS